MNKDITYYAKSRQSAKAYNPSKKISAENVDKVKELLRYSPSSVNAQPWHFVLSSSDEAKAKIVKATEKLYPFNSQSIKDASHIVVFSSRRSIEEDYLLRVLEQEELDGRFVADPIAFKERMHAGRNMFLDLHKNEFNDVEHWMQKQVYLNLGAFLLGVSTLGIDATPMEGIDATVLDQEFGLTSKGFESFAVVTLGYSDAKNDFNAALPKSRLPYADILTEV